MGLPLSHVLKISGHSKAVSCLAMDRGGGLLVSGSNDYHIKYYNLGGMSSKLEHFRVLDPIPFHVVKKISFSSDQKELLVVGGNA